jgi:hypothetical protein
MTDLNKAWMQVTLPSGKNYKGYATIISEGEIGEEDQGWRMDMEVFEGHIFKYDQSRHGGVVHKYSPLTLGFIDLACQRNREKAMIARLQRKGRPIRRLVGSMRDADKGMDTIMDVMSR